MMFAISQTPSPGTRMIRFRGDTVVFSLRIARKPDGYAWLRTNIGHVDIIREGIIRSVEEDIPSLGTEWFDIPMRRVSADCFEVTLPLAQVGHFEAKCFFMEKGAFRPSWPDGPNVVVNVEPADTCCANTIYNAFVRQFGPNKAGNYRLTPEETACVDRLDAREYSVIPRSGTFRDLIAELDFIVGHLGCRYLHLLPIHPTPTTYGRMGRFGSPYAALNFTGVDPALAEFDPTKTPLEQFTELVDAVHARHAKIILDIAVNHMGWAANLHETHPHWLVRDENGEIQVPGAWGVKWMDLTSLDYSKKELWHYIARVFLAWCRRGVDGFRCDAGYMIPVPAWTYITAIVRQQFPDTIFFLEGLGGKISVTRDILNMANFNWAYSELFQNYDRGQIEYYLPGAMDISERDGLTVHFAETHDNNRLAARSRTWARLRTALCALTSPQGGFGFANGVEWFAAEKIDVHESPSLNWGAPDNQADLIRRLTILLKTHPCFFDSVRTGMIQTGEGNHVVFFRHHQPTGKKLLIVVNLDDERSARAWWRCPPETADQGYVDLLSGREITVVTANGEAGCDLGPGDVFCLSADSHDLELFDIDKTRSALPKRLLRQRFRAKAMEVFCFYHHTGDVAGIDFEAAAGQLSENPIDFCRSFNPDNGESRVITWQWPHDLNREVMVPPGHFLMVRAAFPFRAAIIENHEKEEWTVSVQDGLPAGDRTWFALFCPPATPPAPCHRTLKMNLYDDGGYRHLQAPVLFLSDPDNVTVRTIYNRYDVLAQKPMLLCTNRIGGMLRADALWGKLNSKYDALLAANLNPDFPEDRWIMFTRCRAWTVYQGFSQEICFDCLDSFWVEKGIGYWHYRIPTGQGERIDLIVGVRMAHGENAVRISFFRKLTNGASGALDDNADIQLILRPDIEDRNFHYTTKAYTGPENVWPNAVSQEADGFVFRPDPSRKLRLSVTTGRFIREPEWYYMVRHPLDGERGMDDSSDLFSPGYFSIFLKGGRAVHLDAVVNGRKEAPFADVVRSGSGIAPSPGENLRLESVLSANLSDYVVKRGDLQSVIAGYPWFLDWGRDSLIAVRGLIAAGMTAEARAVIKQFGRFEKDGTLPNMIIGDNAGNRDTSDAPLWFFAACADMIRLEQKTAFLDEQCGDRTIREILLSIAGAYLKGTFNNIHVDRESGLVFSPRHFTWMDTDHPACTPRQGYCIEIQALWHAALTLLSEIDVGSGADWLALAKQVRESITGLFIRQEGYLSDCLHAENRQSARQATADDALRPNQLLAITLGAVSDKKIGREILEACGSLLVPGAIRSLADRPVTYPIRIEHHGNLLNNPYAPYQGKYQGDEDSRRKPAYHNGTAWTWMYPLYCEAWAVVYGRSGKPAARSWLTAGVDLVTRGCSGHLPEILDGDFPHMPRGCDAQAWGLSEWVRVWEQLK